MNNTIPNFDKQSLTVKNELVTVEILFERMNNQNEFLYKNSYDKVIELNEIENSSSSLILKIYFQSQLPLSILIQGIDGGIFLHTANGEKNSYSVKLLEDTIVFSLGFTFFMFDLINLDIRWKIRPDLADIFEFYNLQDDYLLRGELAIHRIDKCGNVKWSYGGKDIWVNINGKPEVIIENDKILLTDFENNEYIINFDGETLEDTSRLKQQKIRRWWKFW